MLLRYYSSDFVCEMKEYMYDGADFQLALSTQLELLLKHIVSSSLVTTNVNPVRALQCDFYGNVRPIAIVY